METTWSILHIFIKLFSSNYNTQGSQSKSRSDLRPERSQDRKSWHCNTDCKFL